MSTNTGFNKSLDTLTCTTSVVTPLVNTTSGSLSLKSAGGSAVTIDGSGNTVVPGYINLSTSTSVIQSGGSAFAWRSSNGFTTALGIGALANNSGDYNIGVGFNALHVNTSGTENVAIGASALSANLTGQGSVAIGFESLQNSTANYNTAVGNLALNATVTGGNNTAVGTQALQLCTASNNTALGFGSLALNTSGSTNTAIGVNTLATNISGGSNTAVGHQALLNNTASYNTAVGYFALGANTSSEESTAVGYNALGANTGSNNTAVGTNALSANTTGSYNTVIGRQALWLSSASSNTGMGWEAMHSATTGDQNSVFGTSALSSATSPSNSIAIGYLAASNVTGSPSNNIHIGNSGSSSDTSVIIIGNGQTSATINATTTNVSTLSSSVGILLPTSGGSATTLDYNEAGTLTRTWSGIWASPQNGNILYSRIGKTVTLTITLGSAVANTASFISLVTALPTNLRPPNTVYCPLIVNNGTVGSFGGFNLQSNGTIQITVGAASGNFSGSGNSGLFADFSISYKVT